MCLETSFFPFFWVSELDIQFIFIQGLSHFSEKYGYLHPILKIFFQIVSKIKKIKSQSEDSSAIIDICLKLRDYEFEFRCTKKN